MNILKESKDIFNPNISGSPKFIRNEKTITANWFVIASTKICCQITFPLKPRPVLRMLFETNCDVVTKHSF